MYKILALLGIPAVVIFVFVWLNESNSLSQQFSDQTSLEIESPKNKDTLGVSTSEPNKLSDWARQEDVSVGIGFKTPKGVTIEKTPNNVIEIKTGEINLLMSKEKLDEKENINTVAEKHIDAKVQNLGERYKLTEIISPVAISGVTGISYADEVDGREITYFFVPVGQNYIYIENSTNTKDSVNISTADNIIYSLELL